MTDTIKGVLEIDTERGVVYFHPSSKKVLDRFGTPTILRVCQIKGLKPNEAIDVVACSKYLDHKKATNAGT